MPTGMSLEERENFLTGPWVAVLSIPNEGRGPLAVPVWYLYEPGGDICIWTGSKSRKGHLLWRSNPRAGLPAWLTLAVEKPQHDVNSLS